MSNLNPIAERKRLQDAAQRQRLAAAMKRVDEQEEQFGNLAADMQKSLNASMREEMKLPEAKSVRSIDDFYDTYLAAAGHMSTRIDTLIREKIDRLTAIQEERNRLDAEEEHIKATITRGRALRESAEQMFEKLKRTPR